MDPRPGDSCPHPPSPGNRCNGVCAAPLLPSAQQAFPHSLPSLWGKFITLRVHPLGQGSGMMQMSNGWHQQEGDPGGGREGDLGVRTPKLSCEAGLSLLYPQRDGDCNVLSCQYPHCVSGT